MQFMRLAEVPSTPRDRVFRYSPARALLAAFAVTAVSGGLVWVGWQRQSGLAYYLAGVLLLGLVVLQTFIRARFRPSNWLVRMSDGGVFVQFRSYLNYRFPGEDVTVVFIPYREIRSVRLVRERRDIPGSDERGRQAVSRQSRCLVEFELTGDLAPLVQALADESARCAPEARRRGFTLTQYRHHPARMVSPTRLQLEWNVVPSHRVLLDALRRHTDITPPTEVSKDYVNLKGLDRKEQEERLLELAETGQIMEAITLARRLYSYDLKEAKTLVESLLGRKPGV